MHYEYDEDRYVLDVPTECPKCGGKLELDISIDGKTTYLICSNNDCNYKEDVTDEFESLDKVEGYEED